LNEPEVIEALHVKKVPEGGFKLFSSAVYNDFAIDSVQSYSNLYSQLLTSTSIQVYLVIGDFDIMDGPTGQYAWLETLSWSDLPYFLNS